MSANNQQGGKGNNNNGNNNGKKPYFGKKPYWNKKKSNTNNSNNNDNENNSNPNGQKNSYGNNRNSNNNWRKNNNSKKPFEAAASADLNDVIDDESTPSGLIFNSTAQNEEECFIEDLLDCPYSMWHLYFPKEKYKEQSETHQMTETFFNLIESKNSTFDINKIKENGYFSYNYDELCKEQKNFQSEFVSRPEFYLNCFGMAMHQFILKKYQRLHERLVNSKLSDTSTAELSGRDKDEIEEIDIAKELYSFGNNNQIPTIRARITNFKKITNLKNVGSSIIERFVCLNGTISKISNIKPYLSRLAFECKKCKITFQLPTRDGVFHNPSRCASKLCNSRAFIPLLKNIMTKVINQQTMQIQEVIQDSKEVESGRVPRTIDCELFDDLTGICNPGDLITVNGIIKIKTLEASGLGRSIKDKVSSTIYLKVNTIQGKDNSDVESSKNTEFTQLDMEGFQRIKHYPDCFKLLVNSLCPSIFGHELVKAGLILGLFGGSKTGRFNDVLVRSDSHVLIVGDPGLGKSQLLRACANVSNRGVFVCGNSTTSAGLTVTVAKGAGDDFSLEAGALLCAHNGCCCVDELDKMTAQQQTLLEVMEQQCISIAKCGIVCNLPCKTTILAAANPCGGHYLKSKTVSENLKISGPLLSRFDLVFILMDKADSEMDYRMGCHILKKSNVQKYENKTTSNQKNVSNSFSILSTASNTQKNETLAERLRLGPDETNDPVPAQLLRKARRVCNPELSSEASDVLSSFYLSLRAKNETVGTNAVTLRQLESLIRLTQARAKTELRQICTKADAEEVIEIMKSSMVDCYEDEFGELDFSRSLNGSSCAQISTIKEFVGKLQSIAAKKNSKLFSREEITQLFNSANFKKIKSVNDLIDKLNGENYLLNKGSNLYELKNG